MPVTLSPRDQLSAEHYLSALAEAKKLGSALGQAHRNHLASPQEINVVYGTQTKALAEGLSLSLRPPRVAWRLTNLVLFVVGLATTVTGAFGSSTVPLVLGFLVLLTWSFSGLARLVVENVSDKAAREQITKMLYSAGIDEILHQLQLRRYDGTSGR